jgi:hypothetical protein
MYCGNYCDYLMMMIDIDIRVDTILFIDCCWPLPLLMLWYHLLMFCCFVIHCLLHCWLVWWYIDVMIVVVDVIHSLLLLLLFSILLLWVIRCHCLLMHCWWCYIIPFVILFVTLTHVVIHYSCSLLWPLPLYVHYTMLLMTDFRWWYSCYSHSVGCYVIWWYCWCSDVHYLLFRYSLHSTVMSPYIVPVLGPLPFVVVFYSGDDVTIPAWRYSWPSLTFIVDDEHWPLSCWWFGDHCCVLMLLRLFVIVGVTLCWRKFRYSLILMTVVARLSIR